MVNITNKDADRYIDALDALLDSVGWVVPEDAEEIAGLREKLGAATDIVAKRINVKPNNKACLIPGTYVELVPMDQVTPLIFPGGI